eukprot:m.39658 g.39658  ORF g.39658 m.39658 type:complete len:269 (-) comp9579_c0_seq2:3320-4126(-)
MAPALKQRNFRHAEKDNVTETKQLGSERRGCCCGIHGRFEGENYIPSVWEERINVITAWIGILFAWFVYDELTRLSDTDLEYTVALSYGVSMIFLFGASTFYHWVLLIWPNGSALGRAARLADRSMIFVFIAASYTPFLQLFGDLGVAHIDGHISMSLVWIGAVAGVIYSLFFLGTLSKRLELYMYILQGAGPAIWSLSHLRAKLPGEVATWLLIGGLAYLFGTFFYASDGKIPHAHGLWHLFVLFGAAGVNVAVSHAYRAEYHPIIV